MTSYRIILFGGSDSGELHLREQNFKYLYWTMSKIKFWNLFTCKGTYMIDWVGRIVWKPTLGPYSKSSCTNHWFIKPSLVGSGSENPILRLRSRLELWSRSWHGWSLEQSFLVPNLFYNDTFVGVLLRGGNGDRKSSRCLPKARTPSWGCGLVEKNGHVRDMT